MGKQHGQRVVQDLISVLRGWVGGVVWCEL